MTGRWSTEQANVWGQSQPWLVGCNFIPSTAINQLEMWQAETFDPQTIDRELAWAAALGFNSIRVYLHDLVWKQDADGFKHRIDQYLGIASKHGISTLFVIFDDCWYSNPKLGRQPAPVPGLHNSGWVQSPGQQIVRTPRQWPLLRAYIQDLLRTFGSDSRIVMWDLYNEVGNNYLPALSKQGLSRWPALFSLWVRRRMMPNHSLELLKATFGWAWEVRPSQPLTSSVWRADETELNAYVLEVSDVITFHNYFDADHLQAQIARLKQHGRPLVCTEYMARPRGSRIETHLPIFQRERVGCYNWGLVSGKTQTIHSWRSPLGSSEPELWFHDILRQDGTPFSPQEADLIRSLATPHRILSSRDHA